VNIRDVYYGTQEVLEYSIIFFFIPEYRILFQNISRAMMIAKFQIAMVVYNLNKIIFGPWHNLLVSIYSVS